MIRLLSTVVLQGLLALAVAGCALPSRAPQAPDAGASAPPPLDLAAKFRVPREGKKRDRAAVSAEFHLAMEADEEGPPRAHQLFRAQAQREALVRESSRTDLPKAAGLQPSQWQALGPANVGGRVRSIAVDPRNANRLFAGTASGGIWLTENAAVTWRAIFDFLPNLSVTTIVFDPANSDVLYLGTGEASQGLVGVGVFKSTDGGLTWRHLAATNTDANADWRFVNRLAIHPTQPQVLLAGVTNTTRTTGGIYRSTDGGTTWTRAAAFKALDIVFDPNNPANAVAGLDDGTIAYSRDAGLTWVRTSPLVATPSGRGSTARAEIAFARSQPGRVYASVDNAKGEAWSSDDAGATWALLSTPAHLNLQGDYDNAIWVDPTDATHVVVGGLDLYQSRDAGLTFSKVSDWRYAPDSPHADHHAIVAAPGFGAGNYVVYNGNDGGVYRAANIYAVDGAPSGNGWTHMNNGLAVTQFYSGAGRTAAGARVFGGTQDNGSLRL
ncbi:MAG: WD40/YVTN/BNR-like repeat-containing protein, partial [Arenimonas sp.]